MLWGCVSELEKINTGKVCRFACEAKLFLSYFHFDIQSGFDDNLLGIWPTLVQIKLTVSEKGILLQVLTTDRCSPFPSWWRFVEDGTSVCGVARSFDVSQECGRDAVRWALTLWERARRLSRMASICSSLWGGTEGPSMFLTTLWELDSMRWREGPASCCGILVLNLPENAKTGRLTTGASFSSKIRADSHWACVIDVKESEEAECG